MNAPLDFDRQAAWMRRFSSDAESNLAAFALRLREAMPELVTVHEQKGFGMVVRGITLSTREVAPDAWFAELSAETQKASTHAQSLSQSLQNFMAG
jgi:hypothetical protein